MKNSSLLFVCAALLAALFSPAQAAVPKKLGKFGYWSAYHIADQAQPVCYMTLSAKPPVPKGSKLNRGEVTLMITHRPAEGALDVISYAAGTKFKASSEVTVQVGDKSFNLFTQADTAWARDSVTDRALTSAIRSAQSITITGTAAIGGPFADTITMKGSAEAYRTISQACGVGEAEPAPTVKKVQQPAKPQKPALPAQKIEKKVR